MEILFSSRFIQFETILLLIFGAIIVLILLSYLYNYIARIIRIFGPKKRDAILEARANELLKKRELSELEAKKREEKEEEIAPPLTIEEIEKVENQESENLEEKNTSGDAEIITDTVEEITKTTEQVSEEILDEVAEQKKEIQEVIQKIDEQIKENNEKILDENEKENPESKQEKEIEKDTKEGSVQNNEKIAVSENKNSSTTEGKIEREDGEEEQLQKQEKTIKAIHKKIQESDEENEIEKKGERENISEEQNEQSPEHKEENTKQENIEVSNEDIQKNTNNEEKTESKNNKQKEDNSETNIEKSTEIDEKEKEIITSEKVKKSLEHTEKTIQKIISEEKKPAEKNHTEELFELTKQAKTYMARNMIAEARAVVIEGLSFKKDHRDLNLILGTIYEHEKDFEKAEMIYKDTAFVHHEDTEVLKRLADLLIITKNYPVAYELYKKILTLGGDEEDALYILTHLAGELEDMSDVYKYARLYLKQWPTNKEILTLLSESQITLGKRKEAIETLIKIKNISPYHSEEIQQLIDKLVAEEEMAGNFNQQ